MPWTDYQEEAASGLDQVEREKSRAWVKALAVIVAWEIWLRRRILDHIDRMPIVDGGWFDTNNRVILGRIRAAIRRDVNSARRGLIQGLAGGSSPYGGIPPKGGGGGPRGGVTPSSIRSVSSVFEETWRRMQQEAAGAAPVSTPPSLPLLPVLPTPEQPETSGGRRSEDLFEVTDDAIINIFRNVGYELDRVIETVNKRLLTRMGKRDDIRSYLIGGGGSVGRPWQLNRNNMQLSTTAHVRAAYRRRSVSEGLAEKYTHFRLDVPMPRFGQLSRASLSGRYVWQVRTLDEWRQVAAELNAGRIAASAFDSLGFGFSDFTYIVPVPPAYLNDAVTQGQKWRARFLGEVSAIGLLGRAG